MSDEQTEARAIARFRIDWEHDDTGYPNLVRVWSDDGPFVSYDDHATALAAKEAELAEIRLVLASIDVCSLPDDFPTIEMAKLRMQTLNERTLDGLAAIGRAERAEAQLAERAGVVKVKPRLTDAMIRAACKAHFGSELVDGVNVTAHDIDWSFRDAFRRMWHGAFSAPTTEPATPSETVITDNVSPYSYQIRASPGTVLRCLTFNGESSCNDPAAPEGQQDDEPRAYIVHAPEDDYYGTGPDRLQFHPLAQRDLDNGYRQTPLYTRPSEQAVTEAMVERIVQATRRYTRETFFIEEHRELVRAVLALKEEGL